MSRYKVVVEDVLNATILDEKKNYIVALCSTKRPDQGFEKLKGLVDQANKTLECRREEAKYKQMLQEILEYSQEGLMIDEKLSDRIENLLYDGERKGEYIKDLAICEKCGIGLITKYQKGFWGFSKVLKDQNNNPYTMCPLCECDKKYPLNKDDLKLDKADIYKITELEVGSNFVEIELEGNGEVIELKFSGISKIKIAETLDLYGVDYEKLENIEDYDIE